MTPLNLRPVSKIIINKCKKNKGRLKLNLPGIMSFILYTNYAMKVNAAIMINSESNNIEIDPQSTILPSFSYFANFSFVLGFPL